MKGKCKECGEDFKRGQAVFSVTVTPLTPGRWGRLKKSVRPICACCASIHVARAEGEFHRHRRETHEWLESQGMPIPPMTENMQLAEYNWRTDENWDERENVRPEET